MRRRRRHQEQAEVTVEETVEERRVVRFAPSVRTAAELVADPTHLEAEAS